MMRLSAYGSVALALLLLACGDDEGADGSGGSGASNPSGGNAGEAGAGNGSSTQTCDAVLTFLQKDAYKETAGRTSELWPPHTTTTFEITCEGEVVASAFMANHGTEPGAVDANGDVFLEPVGSVAMSGPRGELEALLAGYQQCECDTQFLSLDALEDGVVQELVGEITTYITDNLTCSGAVSASELADLLAAGDIEGVLAELPSCTWAAGQDFETGFDQALQAIIAATNETLSQYHVCNNDALIQQELVQLYVDSQTVGACGAGNPLCAGPAWYFQP